MADKNISLYNYVLTALVNLNCIEKDYRKTVFITLILLILKR